MTNSKHRDSTGKFVRNNNRWETKDGLIYCYLDDELLFFTDDNRVTNYSWAKLAKGYSATYIDKTIIPVHRFISQPHAEELVDHINRDKKDNRKCNLRNTNKQVNAYNTGLRIDNTSGVKGVFYRKDTGKWGARIMVNQRTIYLGCYSTKAEAVAARKGAERVIYDKQ